MSTLRIARQNDASVTVGDMAESSTSGYPYLIRGLKQLEKAWQVSGIVGEVSIHLDAVFHGKGWSSGQSRQRRTPGATSW
jgi:hypothetical protein